MQLNVLTSKKGTKVVTATNLHLALGLPNHHYGLNVRRWLRDTYELPDGIRRPEPLRDFARRPMPDQPLIEDYYLTLDLAKQIALQSKSKEKVKFARFLSIASNNYQMQLFSQAA